jgi:hypothetical protein
VIGGEVLTGPVFVEKSVVESYSNDRYAICRRVYPARPDRLGVSLAAHGGAAHLVQAEVAAYSRATVNSTGEDSRKQLFVCDFPTLGSEEVI